MHEHAGFTSGTESTHRISNDKLVGVPFDLQLPGQGVPNTHTPDQSQPVKTAGFKSMDNSQAKIKNDSLDKDGSSKQPSILQRHSFEHDRSY